jgi:hypothetical protein
MNWLSVFLVDAGWLGFLAGAGILLAASVLFYVSHLLGKKGVLKNYSRGLGRGILHAEAVLTPSKAHVMEVQEKQEREDDDQSRPDSPNGPRRVK